MASNRRQIGTAVDAGEKKVVTSLLRSAAVVRRRLNSLCADHDLTFRQYCVLRILGDAHASSEGPIPTMEVAARMIEPEPGITRMMERLEYRGLVRRERSADDARFLLCRITRKALAALARLEEPVNRMYETVLTPLSGDERLIITDLLERICGSNAERP